MKKSIFIITCFAVILSSCSKLDKPIFDEISIEDLADITQKDTLFKSTYEQIEGFKKLVDDKLILAKYSDLTWQDFHDYNLFLNDVEYWEPTNQKFKEDYKNKYDSIKNAGLEYIENWKSRKLKWEKENNPNNYVKIELIGIKTNYYEYSGSLDDVTLTFKLYPLIEKVQQVVWSINPRAKINGDVDKNSVSFMLDSQRYIYSIPFSNSVTGRYEASYSHEKKFATKSSKYFLRDYNLNLDIKKVRIRDKNYELDGFDIPFEVEQYLKYESGLEKDEAGIMMDYYQKSTIKENIHEGYIDESDFLSDKKSEILEEKYPKVYEFQNEYVQALYNNIKND